MEFEYDQGTGQIKSDYNGQCIVATETGGPGEYSVATAPCGSSSGNSARNTEDVPTAAVFDAWSVGTDGSIRPRADSTQCLSVPPPAGSTNVWSKLMVDGSVVVTYLNVGSNSTDIACDSACLSAATGWDPATNATVRDVVTRTDNGTISLSNGFVAKGVMADGGVSMIRLHKVFV